MTEFTTFAGQMIGLAILALLLIIYGSIDYIIEWLKGLRKK